MAFAKNMGLILLVLVVSASATSKTLSSQRAELSVNPIRRVVTMLQMMQKKVEAEGEKQKEAYDKFMCWCSNGEGQLEASIEAAKVKIPQVTSTIKEGEASLTQTKADVASAKTAREAAKAAMAEAGAIREKEAATYAAAKTEADTNLAALKKALAAIEKGTGASFLQTHLGQVLQNLIVNDESLSDIDREVVTSFLSTDSSAAGSGQITGILKQMGDTMAADIADLAKTEDAAKAAYSEMTAAKTKEVEALTKSIEEKTVRIGDLSVEVAQAKEDLDDTEKQLVDDEKFLADLDKNCAAKKVEWEETVKMRGMELVAIADTIKILNDDDALELFKKTLPSASFIQEQFTMRQVRNQALVLLQDTRRKHPHTNSRTSLEFLTLVLAGKKPNFDKVLGMIDDLTAALEKEQADDDKKKDYCGKQLDTIEDQMKVLKQEVEDLDALIGETSEKITTVIAEIKALQDGIAQLDKDVAEATENRKEENEDFQALMTSDTAAKELIGFAKNRLNKFYNPKLYKAPPKRALSEADRATLAAGGTLAPTMAPGGIAGTGIGFIQLHEQRAKDDAAPPPPPEAAVGYQKKGEESGGVIAMMDAMIGDLEKEMETAETDEKSAQKEYEEFLEDSKEKRATDAKAITDKSAAKAELEGMLEKARKDHAGKGKELMAAHEVLAHTHGECDFLLQNYDARKEARTEEEENLKKAKGVLSGADFSLVQRSTSHRLRGPA